MRILVFGGRGQLGADLAAAASLHTLYRPARSEADVTDIGSLERLANETQPDAIVNAAAFHKVELCEQDPERSFAVNELGARNGARVAASIGSPYVFVSTDYVFGADDRTRQGYVEQDPVGPLNVYGDSKAAGEKAVLAVGGHGLVVRASGLFGHAGSSGKGGNFVETMLRKASEGEAISVVDDQIFSPTATHDLAERILLLLERGAPRGIYHAANAGSCSWYGLAKRVLELAGVEADLTPRPTGRETVRRPRFSVLLDTKGAALGLPPARTWEQALSWYLESKPAREEEPAPRSAAS